MLKTGLRIVLIPLAVLSLAGCRRDAPTGDNAGADAKRPRSIRVTDAKGRKVKIALPVRRVISLSSDGAEVIRALGGADRIVGVNSTVAGDTAFWPELSALPQIGGAFEPNCEVIAELRPDLVIAYGMRPGAAFETKMSKFDIQVLRVDCYKPERMSTDVRALGRILEREQNAAKLIAFMKKWTRVVEGRLHDVPEESRPRVYVEGYGDFRGSGPGSGGNAMCELAGARNIVASLGTRYPKVSSEWVIEQNPDVILKAVSSSTGIGGYTATSDEGMKRLHDEIASRTGWERIAAVRDGRVCLVSADVWLGPAYVAAHLQLAKWFYPTVFEDIEPREVLLEYLDTFHGLSNTGVPFYP